MPPHNLGRQPDEQSRQDSRAARGASVRFQTDKGEVWRRCDSLDCVFLRKRGTKMEHMRNLRDGLMFCAITTFVMGAANRAVAQNQPAIENPSAARAAAEQA